MGLAKRLSFDPLVLIVSASLRRCVSALKSVRQDRIINEDSIFGFRAVGKPVQF